jgi:hypothetical protein
MALLCLWWAIRLDRFQENPEKYAALGEGVRPTSEIAENERYGW